jgi:hypothetical protein
MKLAARAKVGLALLTLAGILGVAWQTRYPPDPFMGSAIHNPPFTATTHSIHSFLWWDANNAGLQLDWAKLMGFRYVKQIFAWRDMEPERGLWSFVEADRVVQQAADYGVGLIVRLGETPDWASGVVSTSDEVDYLPQNLDDWANFCGTLAARYAGRIRAYQIWNEPNLSREWGTAVPNAAQYVELLAACSTAIRAADPQAIVISAGLSPTGNHDDSAHRDDIYLAELYQAGFQQYVDVVGVHAPGFAPPAYGPDDAERDGRGRWATFRRVEMLPAKWRFLKWVGQPIHKIPPMRGSPYPKLHKPPILKRVSAIFRNIGRHGSGWFR